MPMDIQSILNPQASGGSNASTVDVGGGCAESTGIGSAVEKRKRGATLEAWEDGHSPSRPGPTAMERAV